MLRQHPQQLAMVSLLTNSVYSYMFGWLEIVVEYGITSKQGTMLRVMFRMGMNFEKKIDNELSVGARRRSVHKFLRQRN